MSKRTKYVLLIIFCIYVIFAITCGLINFYHHHTADSYAKELQQLVAEKHGADITYEMAMDWLEENGFNEIGKGWRESSTYPKKSNIVRGEKQIYGKWLFIKTVSIDFTFLFSLDDKFIITEYDVTNW